MNLYQEVQQLMPTVWLVHGKFLYIDIEQREDRRVAEAIDRVRERDGLSEPVEVDGMCQVQEGGGNHIDEQSALGPVPSVVKTQAKQCREDDTYHHRQGYDHGLYHGHKDR